MGFRRGESGGRSSGGAPMGFGAGAVPLLSLSQSLALAKQEFARARRYGYPLTLGVARVDRLENLSDLYGKEARPMLFEQVARLFQSRSRTTDLLGRLSDERLLWVLPHTELGGARIAADRMRCAVEELELQSGRRSIHVTLSIGLACYFAQNTLFFDSLLMQTEQALERAQTRGGNLVEEHPLPASAREPEPEGSDAEPGDTGRRPEDERRNPALVSPGTPQVLGGGSRSSLLFCALALLLLLVSWGRHLDTPFSRVVGFADWIGNENGRFAWNHVRYGFAETRGAQVRNLEAAPPEDRLVYHAHPGTLDVLVGVVFSVLGHKAVWAHRLVPLIAALLGLVLLARLARAIGVDPPLALGLYALLPMTNVHGINLSYEPLCLAAILGLVLLHHRGWRWRLLPLLWLFGLIDYPVLYLGPWFALVALLRRERSLVGWLLWTGALAGVCLASIGTHVAHLLWSMGGLRAGHGAAWDEYILQVLSKGAASLPAAGEFLASQAGFLIQGYTLPLLGAGLVGVVLLSRERGRWPFAYAFGFVGGLHFVAFPAHAWRHDFWLCYLAPLVALASARMLSKAPRPLLYFTLSLACVLATWRSERIWQERAAPPVQEMGEELAAEFADEAVLFAFRTPAPWALEFWREHPVHEAERLFLPGEEARNWAQLIEDLGTLGQLDRPMFGVLPRRFEQFAPLLDSAFPGARRESRGSYHVWELGAFVREPGRSPYVRDKLGAGLCARLARRVSALRALVLVPPGAHLHVLGPDRASALWFRSRRLSTGPLAAIEASVRADAYLAAEDGSSEAAALRERFGTGLELRELPLGLRILLRAPR